MPAVLTTASTVGCGHDPGQVSTSSAAKLTVSGAAVLLQDSIAGKSVSGCGTTPSSSTSQCVTVSSVISGLAQKLTAGGAPVALATVVGLTDGVPPGALKTSNVQSKLTTS